MEAKYILIRSNIKNVYIQIKDGEVIVKAPKHFSRSTNRKNIKPKRAMDRKKFAKI